MKKYKAMEDERGANMEKDPFKEYLRECEPDKAKKGYLWSTAIGLQAVDGLKPSQYLIDTAIQNIEGKITIKEAKNLIESYYEERPMHLSDDERTEEQIKYRLALRKYFLKLLFHFLQMSTFLFIESCFRVFMNTPVR